MNQEQIKKYAREVVEERVKGEDGYYHTLVDFIAAIAGVDRRKVDVNLLRASGVDLQALREKGL